MILPTSTRPSVQSGPFSDPGTKTKKSPGRAGVTPLGKSGGSFPSPTPINPCPNGRVICAAIGYWPCAPNEHGLMIGSCSLNGDPGQQYCCTAYR